MFENITIAAASQPHFLNVVERQRSTTRRCVNAYKVILNERSGQNSKLDAIRLNFFALSEIFLAHMKAVTDSEFMYYATP